jgi:uncharacterized protein YecE (DUF72 family)
MVARAERARCEVGTSGWVYPHWRGVFYPVRSSGDDWLEHYAAHFHTVEINYTFYRLPSEEAVAQWEEGCPEGFVYAVKASRYITHMKKLQGVEEALPRFLERVRGLADHLGPILYQLPPRWNCNLERLRTFLQLLPADLRHAMEFRNTTWLCEAVYDLLAEHSVGLCIVSLPDFPCILRATAPFVYIRLHGSEAKYGSCYSEDELSWWAEQVLGYLQEGKDVYAYFNNDACGYAVHNALRLKQLVGEWC